MVIVLYILIFTLIQIGAICDAYMDKWMEYYINKSYCSSGFINPSWFSFNPLAKWKNGNWNTMKADNYLFLKLGIKTTLLTDNCNDGWHFFKSIMIVCLLSAVVIAIILGALIGFKNTLYYTVAVILLGFAWNLTFNYLLKNKI